MPIMWLPRAPGRRLVSVVFAVVLACAAPVAPAGMVTAHGLQRSTARTSRLQAGDAARTPRKPVAEVYLPLEVSGAQSFYSSTVASHLKDEGYQTHVTLGLTQKNQRRGGCLTLTSAAQAGIIIIDVPVKLGRILPLCGYLNNATGRGQEVAELKQAQRSLGRANVGSACSAGFCAVGITASEIARQGNLFKDTLVILAMPNATTFAGAFDQAGALNVISSLETSGRPVSNLFVIMEDGLPYPQNPTLADNARRAIPQAISQCGGGCPQMSAASSTLVTLAPSVLDRSPDPKQTVFVGTPFSVTVHFDTEMQGSSGSADGVVTLDGCDNKAAAGSHLTWQDNHTVSGDYDIQSSGTLTITVHAGAARSDGARIELDGNQEGTVAYDGATGPNGDDYVWKVSCSARDVHIVFQGSGTARHSIVSTFTDGEEDTDTDTDQVSWTAVYNLNLTQIADGEGSTGYVEQSDTFDPAASTLSGTSSDSVAVDACPSGGCVPRPPCTGTFTRRTDVTPDLYVYSPPATDGTLKMRLPPYTLLDGSAYCAGSALQDTCDPQIAGTPGSDSTGPLSADITMNPKTWKSTSYSVQPTAPITWSCTSSDGHQTDSGNVTWSGTVTLSIPKNS